MVKIDLYAIGGSAPCRAVLLTLKALNVPFEYKLVNLMTGENRTPEYLAINPHGTVPTLVDDGVVLTDSHAIITYMVDKYGTDDSLYPKDLVLRAKVNQVLFYEATVVFDRTFLTISKAVFNNNNVIPYAKIDAVYKVYEQLEGFLQAHPYVAGEKLTVADFSLAATVTSLFTYAELDTGKYPKIHEWVTRLEELPYYAEANGAGLKQYNDVVKAIGFKVLR
ncbi:PREDICTED: glutathione S-transferase 1-like [Bactrocera latifrons]|uniref:Glutathione S-transferase 1 n=1 Tax=Bactrocera latifrons TaxID=174628 RepID=A0A0K8VYW9_BACLA|nr:PREDICTED: glutathione S-transferase 1-like [Bactrocera latifrons]